MNKEQAEKKQVLLNDKAVTESKKEAQTLFERAQNEIGNEMGRFSHLAKQQSVVGASPSYPAQPDHSPFRRDLTGDELPLGYSVDDVPLVGTPAEIEQSLMSASPAPVISADVLHQPSADEGDALASLKRRI